jgi:hypothetical protein
MGYPTLHCALLCRKPLNLLSGMWCLHSGGAKTMLLVPLLLSMALAADVRPHPARNLRTLLAFAAAAEGLGRSDGRKGDGAPHAGAACVTGVVASTSPASAPSKPKPRWWDTHLGEAGQAEVAAAAGAQSGRAVA